MSAELEIKLIALGEYPAKLKKFKDYLALKTNFEGKLFDTDNMQIELDEAIEHNTKVELHNVKVDEKASLLKKLAGISINEKYFTMSVREVVTHEDNLKKYKKLSKDISLITVDSIEHINLDELAAELQVLTKDIRTAEAVPSHCPTCKQSWPSEPLDIESMRQTKDKKTADFNTATVEHKKFGLEVVITQFEKLDLMNEEEIAEAYMSLDNKDAYNRLKLLETVGTELLEARPVKRLSQELQKARLQNRWGEELTTLGVQVRPEEVIVQPLKDYIHKLKAELAWKQRDLDGQLKNKAIHKEYSDAYDEEVATFENLKAFVKFIDIYRKSFGANVIPLLQANVSSIVNYLSDGKYETIVVKPDYSIENFDYYSGSEQDSISFALRLAIAQISRLGSFKTMLLDEVAASFDSDREKRLLDILGAQDNQLIYITHGDL